MILSVRFTNINQMDQMVLTVDAFSKEVVFAKEKHLSDNETIFVKIYADGLASFGLHMKSDPMHGYGEYTWSSNPDAVNKQLGLIGTQWELAHWDIAVADNVDSCGYASGILMSIACKLAEANQDLLHHGIVEFYRKHANKVVFAEPCKGLQLTDKKHYIKDPNSHWHDLYIETADGRWVDNHQLSDWYLEQHGRWCLREVLGTTL